MELTRSHLPSNSKPTIGTLNEKPLHAALKKLNAQPGDRFEVAVDGYVIDIVRARLGQQDLLLEIQTANFSAIKTKLNKLVRKHQVRLIYPILQEKWIIKLAQVDDEKDARRKSPKRGRVEDLFEELVRIPHLILHENFALEVLMIQAEEVQRHVGHYAGKRNWRRKGWRVEERRLISVVDRHRFEQPSDFLTLLPSDLANPFTAKELAKAVGVRKALAQKMVYCLRKMEAVELVGKRERSNLYEIPNRKNGEEVT